MFQMSVLDSNEYRAFCRNELSALVDNDGAVCALDILDCFYYRGTVYPDEMKLPIFSRDAAETATGKPHYGPAIQLYTDTASGRVVLHRPTEQRFSLSYLTGGDNEQSYELVMDSNRLLWECTCCAEDRTALLVYVNGHFLFNGIRHTHKDQHRGIGTTQIGDHYKEAGVELDVDLPDLNGTVNVTWTAAGFDEARQVWLAHGIAAYPYGTETYVLAIGADAPATCDTIPGDVTVLRADWDGRTTLHVGAAVGHTEDEAIATLRDGLAQYTALRDARFTEMTTAEQDALCVCTDRMPFAEPFGRAAGAYLDSLTVGPVEDGRIGVRASAHKYGYFSLWDTIYPIRDFLWNGKYADAARILNYLLQLPAMENTPVSAVHLIAQWNEAKAFLPEDLLIDAYPIIMRIFRFLLRLTEPEYGLLLCKANTGVDKPVQMGLSGLFLSPDVNGLWYSVCRIVRNEAAVRGDKELVTQATDAIERMEQGFRRVFFDEDAGYLRSGVNRDFSPATHTVFHNTATLGYDYPYGMYLMREFAPALARYQSHELYHPFGHRAVAVDSEMPYGWWKFVHMNQHNGHEMKLQRTADNVREVHRVTEQLMRRSDRWKNAEETTNFSRFAIHPEQVCDWQTFGATGAMEALRGGVAGIVRHRGGLQYLPAVDHGTVTVKNIPWGTAKGALTIDGHGGFAVLGSGKRVIKGTLQFPADVCTHRLFVHRTSKKPRYPVVLSAIDLPLKSVTVHGRATSFVCGHTAYTPVVWYAPSQPVITVNDEAVSAVWNADTGEVCVDRLWKAGDRVCATV